ncbi:MAG: hypothetical protein ACRYFU_09390 [Janthinobacterium lividum]
MTMEEFQSADLQQLQGLLLALRLDAEGDWQQAHVVAQEIEDRDGAWVHAYLHRKEGDRMNAAYWYRRAGQPVATGELSAEWEAIVRALLNRPQARI